MVESVREINRKYKGEWVFIVNQKKDVHGNLTEGEVVLHSRDKDEVFKRIEGFKQYKSSAAVRYGGYIPEAFVVEI